MKKKSRSVKGKKVTKKETLNPIVRIGLVCALLVIIAILLYTAGMYLSY